MLTAASSVVAVAATVVAGWQGHSMGRFKACGCVKCATCSSCSCVCKGSDCSLSNGCHTGAEVVKRMTSSPMLRTTIRTDAGMYLWDTYAATMTFEKAIPGLGAVGLMAADKAESIIAGNIPADITYDIRSALFWTIKPNVWFKKTRVCVQNALTQRNMINAPAVNNKLLVSGTKLPTVTISTTEWGIDAVFPDEKTMVLYSRTGVAAVTDTAMESLTFTVNEYPPVSASVMLRLGDHTE